MSEQISFNALRAFDTDGLPAGGAQAFFYETGTTTPVTVYAESALTTPLASPHVADSDGYFAQVFSNGAVQIKCVIKDSLGVVLSTIDPVIVSFTSSAATSVTFAPTEEIPQTNVQAAIEQVQDNSTTDIAAAIAAIPATPLATQALAEAGANNTDLMTPLRTAQAIDAQVPDALNATGSAPIYACRAWVNFNGTGTVAILAAGNVSSITDNGAGDYTVNFTTAMPDINYAVTGAAGRGAAGQAVVNTNFALLVSGVRIQTTSANGALLDNDFINVVIHR